MGCEQPDYNNTSDRVYLWIRQISLEVISLFSLLQGKTKVWPLAQYVLGFPDKTESNKRKTLFQPLLTRNISIVYLTRSISLISSIRQRIF